MPRPNPKTVCELVMAWILSVRRRTKQTATGPIRSPTCELPSLRIKRRGIAFFAVLVLHGSVVLGIEPYQPVQGDPLLESWRWRAFQDLRGLDLQCMVEGPDGTMWFGTGDGLASYDGIAWKRELADNNAFVGWVAAICFEADGSLIAGGWWGLSRFHEGRWERLFPAIGLRAPDVRDLMVAPDGAIWAATSWGALRWRASTWTLFTDAATAASLGEAKDYPGLRIELLPDALLAKSRPGSLARKRSDLTDVCIDPQGTIWFGTKGGEVLRLAGPAWTLFNETDGLASGRFASLLPRRDGSLWVAHGSADALSVYDGDTWRRLPLPTSTGTDSARLLETRDGVLWLSSRYMLLSHHDGRWRKYEQPEIPLPLATNHLTQSTDGALWIAGANTEVQRVDYQTHRWLTLHDLNFQWESPEGVQWFLHRNGRIVVRNEDTWLSYGAEDGLIDTPVALMGTRDGSVWAAGSHGQTAATARFDGRTWTRELHGQFAYAIDWRALFESRDGSLWFGAAVDSSGPPEHRDGILQYRNGSWLHHHQPGRSPHPGGVEHPATLLPPSHRQEPIEKYSSLGEARDATIWAGRNILAYYDGKQWTEHHGNPGLRFGIIESMLTTREGDLWVGTRQYGALRYDGRTWRQFQGNDILEANSVRSFTQTADGSVWAATDRGASRFDGLTWAPDVLPAKLAIPHEGGNLKDAPTGALWINHHTVEWNRRAWTQSPRPAPDAVFRTVRHEFRGPPPQTTLSPGPNKISQPGNLSVLWSGVSPWRDVRDGRLQFSHRLDDQPWSPYTSEGGHAFFALSPGPHRLEVRARDREFNIDPTPATLNFVVLPPVWRQAWFILLMILLGGLIITQTIRVFLERGRLRRTNRALATEIDARRRAADEVHRLNTHLERRVEERTAQLEATNRELETFSYSVSHDLRAPLRSIDGFSRALLEDYLHRLDADGQDYLRRICSASQRMGHLIDDLLKLARISRDTLQCGPVDLSTLASTVAEGLRQAQSGQNLEFVITPGLVAHGDARLLRLALENLLGNAVKFSSKRPAARIEFGRTERNGAPAFFVRDNGAGFEPTAAPKLFGAFQRFHTAAEFPGTGIGLATVQRIVHRHGGHIEAESAPDHGATFTFSLPDPQPQSHENDIPPLRGQTG
jgi:signal transduction histidine kinase/ligand-binding sensor domain-containing protein